MRPSFPAPFCCYLLVILPFGISFSTIPLKRPAAHLLVSKMASIAVARRTRSQIKRQLPITSVLASKTKGDKTPVPSSKIRRRVVTPDATPAHDIVSASDSPAASTSSSRSTANVISDYKFQDLQVSPEELRPSATLTTGQCFHWSVLSQSESSSEDFTDGIPISAWGSHNATEWIGTLRTRFGEPVVVVLRETPTTTLFRVLHAPSNLDVSSFLRDYFQLDQPLASLYKEWSRQDKRLARIAASIPGVRIINQDPWECLVSFICSSNNNIPRITKILSALRREYGVPLVHKGEHGLNDTVYSFPNSQELQERATDEDLRKKCGLGYRAKYILETMKILQSLGGEAYLHDLKNQSSEGTLSPIEVQDALMQFCGVGRKVADCAALFSLKQCNAIPVDVHVWNIACRDYDHDGQLKSVKSLTPTVYRQVGDIFRQRFPQNAGWAHSLLFVAELPSFRAVLPVDLLEEMEIFRAEEQSRKKMAKKKNQ